MAVPALMQENAIILKPLQKPLPLPLILFRVALDHADDMVEPPFWGTQPE